MAACPCCSTKEFADCCAPLLEGTTIASNPELLMRSRYSAYTLGRINYIKKTMRGVAALNFDEKDAKQWARSITWQNLKIINSSWSPFSNIGFVEFVAAYVDKNGAQQLHEKSEFNLIDGQWFYVAGEIYPY